MKQELVQKEETQMQTAAVVDQSTAMLQIIERASKDESVDIEKMERLMTMHERMVERQAEAVFHKAMVQAQKEMRPISADAENPQTRSKYASYSQLDKALRPIYTRHGFSLSFDTEDAPKEDEVRVVCYVSHENGHSSKRHVDMPADGKGAKGNAVMTRTHAVGSAMSYGMRYLLKLIFNVSVGEDDDDGNAANEIFITEDQVATLEALITEVKADKDGFLKYLRVSALPALPMKKYEQAVKALEAKRA